MEEEGCCSSSWTGTSLRPAESDGSLTSLPSFRSTTTSAFLSSCFNGGLLSLADILRICLVKVRKRTHTRRPSGPPRSVDGEDDSSLSLPSSPQPLGRQHLHDHPRVPRAVKGPSGGQRRRLAAAAQNCAGQRCEGGQVGWGQRDEHGRCTSAGFFSLLFPRTDKVGSFARCADGGAGSTDDGLNLKKTSRQPPPPSLRSVWSVSSRFLSSGSARADSSDRSTADWDFNRTKYSSSIRTLRPTQT